MRSTPSRPSGFSKAARRSAPAFSCFASAKQPLVIYGSRPTAAIYTRENSRRECPVPGICGRRLRSQAPPGGFKAALSRFAALNNIRAGMARRKRVMARHHESMHRMAHGLSRAEATFGISAFVSRPRENRRVSVRRSMGGGGESRSNRTLTRGIQGSLSWPLPAAAVIAVRSQFLRAVLQLSTSLRCVFEPYLRAANAA